MKFSPAYQAALDYLYSFVDFSMTKMQSLPPETFTLEHMRELLASMQNPQLAYPVVHIAGSKGKGSTAAMIASVLQASGYKVGLYTSPHMIDFNERIQINGQAIPHNEFVELIIKFKPQIESVKKISTFEISTALAFQYFKEQQVDIAIVEVGLGGRLDATNLVQPLLTIITSISLDHTAILGDTLEKIATEKAGIMKSGVPVVLAKQQPAVLNHLKSLAASRDCPVMAAEELVKAEILSQSVREQQVCFDLSCVFLDQPVSKEMDTITLRIPLVGKHQVENAATALLAVLWLSRHGFDLSYNHIMSGFMATKWPGRFEVVQENPLLIVDSAHNPDSAGKLAALIKEVIPEKDIVMLFGASEDKDVYGMLSIFRDIAHHFIFTESVHPRAMCVVELETLGKRLGLSYESVLPMEAAVTKINDTQVANQVCVASGSIFIAGAVKEVLMLHSAVEIHKE